MVAQPTLTAPFKNESKDPRGFTYVPVEDVIERLNLVLGTGAWSYECETAHVDDRGIVVKGRLSACGGVYEQYGGQNYNRFGKDHKSSPGEVMDMGNDFKGAASDALKKCAQQIGVALYIPLGHSPRLSDDQPSSEPASHAAGGDGRAEVPPSPPAPVSEVSEISQASDRDDQGKEAPRSEPQRSTSAVPVGDTDGGGVSFGEAGDPTAVLQLNLDIQGLKGRARAEAMGEKSRLKITDLDGIDPESEEFKLLRAKVSEVMT